MLQFATQNLDVNTILIELSQSVVQKNLQGVKTCIESLESREYSLESLDEIVTSELNCDKGAFIQDLLISVVKFGTLDIFQFLTQLKNLNYIGMTNNLFMRAIACQQNALVIHFLQNENIDKNTLLEGCRLVISQDDTVLLKYFVNPLLEYYEEQAVTDIFQGNFKDKQLIMEHFKEMFNGTVKRASDKIEELKRNENKLLEYLSENRIDLSLEEMTSKIIEARTRHSEHFVQHQRICELFNFNLRWVVAQLKNRLEQESKKTENLKPFLVEVENFHQLLNPQATIQQRIIIPIAKQARELEPNSIVQDFKHNFILENGQHKTLFTDLDTLTPKELFQLQAALKSWIMKPEEVDRIDTLILSILKIDDSLKKPFKQFLKENFAEFGEDTFCETAVVYQACHYPSYLTLTLALLQNPLKYFSSEIFDKVNTLIESRYEPSSPIVPSFLKLKNEKKEEKRESHHGQQRLVPESTVHSINSLGK